jgi:hypothetical protein
VTRKALALILAVLVLGQPLTVMAQSGGNCSIFKSWTVNESLTAADLNSSFTTVGVTNLVQSCIDGISDSAANMQAQTAPWASQTESLATSGAGEFQRLRYVIADFLGLQYWYRTDRNIDFASTHSGAVIQGSGVGRHVTAVALHTWSGFRQGAPRPAQYPAFTSVADHWTGIAWPAVGHMSLVFGDTNVGGGVQGGVEGIRLHAFGMTLHHTAAIRFAHSTSQMHGGQRGHVTALQIHRGNPGQGGISDDNSANEAAYKDSLVLGHASVGLMIHGTGIVGGANRLYGLTADGRYLETKTISGTVTITHQAGQIVFGGQAVITSATADVTTAETTSSTSYTDLTTSGPAVTITPGRTTDQMILIKSDISNSASDRTFMSVAIAGAAAVDANAIQSSGTTGYGGHILTTAVANGSTHTAKYKVNSGTGTFVNRRISAFTLN